MKVKIIKMGINGEGIAYNNNKPVFVPRALIDEICEIKIVDNQKSYAKAELVSIIKESKYRVKPKCKVQHICGGCPLMVLTVSKQVEYKRELLIEALIKYAGIDRRLVGQCVKSPDYLYYRNLLKWPVKMIKDQLYAGMYMEGSNHLVTIDTCIVHDKKIDLIKNKVLAVLNKHHQRDYYDKIHKGIRYIVIRGFEKNYQLTLVTGDNIFTPELIEDLSNIEDIKSIYQNVNTTASHNIMSTDFRNLYGSKTIELSVNGIKARLSPRSFFQLNKKQAEHLYDFVINAIKPCNLLVDAYCGVGIMSLQALSKAEEVIGIEYVADAIKNAKMNAKFNHLEKRVDFKVGDSAEVLKRISKKRTVDAIIVDPPRAGLDDAMIENIIMSKASQLIYVSCNPATLAKNLNILKEYYNIESITPFDMFTHTPHVETVVVMSKK